MRIPRIYTSQILYENAELELEERAAHYLLKVLRMDTGRELVLFNGQGGEFPSLIVDKSKSRAAVKTGIRQDIDRQSPLDTELGIGISRGERMDWVLQKATELGVTAITPVFSERTEVKLTSERLDKRLQHWQNILISACEQCQRNILPVLHAPRQVGEFLASNTAEQRFVLHHRADAQLRGIPQPSSVSLLIGPEGGLSEDEIALASQYNFSALKLGERVLRTETAPIAALAVIQHLWGDL